MWTYSPQKRQVGSAFALTYRLLLRSCKLMGVFVISPLPSFLLESLQTAGLLCSTAITPFRCYYGPIRHPLAFHRFPGFASYTASLLPLLSWRDEEGFSSCSTCPCHRAIPTTPPECHVASVSPRHAMLPSPRSRGLGLRIFILFRGHLWVYFRYGPVTHSP